MSENSYEIYQLKNNETGIDLRFMNTDYLKKKGQKVNRENYDLIYNAPLDTGETLDSIYEKFNLYRPADFRGHSLSVSDVIVFHTDGRDNAYFVDSFGFTEVPEFLQVQVVENTITMASEKITVNQHIGTWYPIDMQEIDGRTYFLLEHETYGSDVAGVIVDEKGALYAQEIFDGFTPEVVEQIRLAAAPIEVMPDPNISVDDMVAYGYSYRGMLPLNADAAKAHWEEAKLMLYALHPDGTESLIDNEKQFERHIENGGLFGIEKEDWMKYLENGEYLRTAEISTERNYNMIDGRRNNMEAPKAEKPDKEKESLLGRLKEKQAQLLVSRKKDAQEKSNERDLP